MALGAISAAFNAGDKLFKGEQDACKVCCENSFSEFMRMRDRLFFFNLLCVCVCVCVLMLVCYFLREICGCRVLCTERVVVHACLCLLALLFRMQLSHARENTLPHHQHGMHTREHFNACKRSPDSSPKTSSPAWHAYT
jgi:hypothetical protein